MRRQRWGDVLGLEGGRSQQNPRELAGILFPLDLLLLRGFILQYVPSGVELTGGAPEKKDKLKPEMKTVVFFFFFFVCLYHFCVPHELSAKLCLGIKS